MPGNKVTLVRHDGSLMDATPEQAGRLQLLGYKPISDEQNMARLTEEARSDYYTAPSEQVSAGLEGLSSGLSFGATDYLMGDEDTKARAQYNPGLRFTTETAGALLPAFLTGGESVGASLAEGAEKGFLRKSADFLTQNKYAAAYADNPGHIPIPVHNPIGAASAFSGGLADIAAGAAEGAGTVRDFASLAPTSLLTKAAHALAPEQTLAGAITRGIIEGGVYGGTGAADHAFLDGEPITAETVLHGIGWGALIGGAIGGVGEAVAKGGEAAYANKQAELRAQEPIPHGALNVMAGSEYGALRDEVVNLSAQAKEAAKVADASFNDVANTLKKANTGYDAIKNFIDAERPIGAQDPAMNFQNEVKKMQSLYEKAAKTAEAGQFNKVQEAVDAYSEHAKGIAQKLGIDIPDPSKAMMDMASMRKMQSIAASMPKSVEAFASLGPKKLEDLMAALKVSQGLPFKNDIAGAADNFIKAMGLDSASGDVLRAAQKSAKTVLNSEGKTPKAPPAPDKGPGLGRKLVGQAAGGKAWLVAKGMGMGRVGAYTAYRGVRDMVTYGSDHLVGMKAAALSGIREAAAVWGPGMGHTISNTGPRTAALGYTIFGEPDTSTKNAQELAKARVKELYSFAPIASDAIYKAVEPMSATQPYLAPSIHKSALQAIQAMTALAPKDPGAMARLQSLWHPSPVQAEILNKQLAVFHDPVGQAVEMLSTGNLDVTKIGALKQLAPGLFDEMRMAMMNRVSDPKILNSLSYQDQIYISVALGIPLHSNASAASISTSQQIFMDRSQPLRGNPRMGPGGGMPNPKDNNYATDSQVSTER